MYSHGSVLYALLRCIHMDQCDQMFSKWINITSITHSMILYYYTFLGYSNVLKLLGGDVRDKINVIVAGIHQHLLILSQVKQSQPLWDTSLQGEGWE